MMGRIRKRIIFEQPVIKTNFLLFVLLAGALGLVTQTTGVHTEDVTSYLGQGLEGVGGQQHAPHPRPLCPDGWVWGSTGAQSFKDKNTGMCLYLSPQSKPWTQARDECHSMNSVLLSLDSVLSAHDTPLHQFLKHKGVDKVWTGMHKDGGRQIWDGPGMDMVQAYTGSRQTYGKMKRGWSWDTSSFSDARLTCGLYTYSDDTLGSRFRRHVHNPGARSRRDTDNPGSSGDLHGHGLARGRKGTGDKPSDHSLSFIPSRGLAHGHENGQPRHNEHPSDKTQTFSPDRKDVLSDKQRDRTNNHPSDKANDNAGGQEHGVSNHTPKPPDKDKTQDTQSDDKGKVDMKNTTVDPLNSDEDDNHHDVVKRSTPLATQVSTQSPHLTNSTAPDNTTQSVSDAIATVFTTTTDRKAAQSLSHDSPHQKDTSSQGMAGPSAPVSKEYLGFFNTDSQDSGSAKSPPAPQPNTKEMFGMSAHDLFKQLDSSITRQLTNTDLASNNNSSTATAQSSSNAQTLPASAQSSSNGAQSSSNVAKTSLVNTQSSTMFGVVASAHASSSSGNHDTVEKKSATELTNTNPFDDGLPTDTAREASQHTSSFANTAPKIDTLAGSHSFSNTSTQFPPTQSTTPDTSSEELTTDSSIEQTNSTASPKPKDFDFGSFFDNAGAHTSANTSAFQQHFGPSSSDSGHAVAEAGMTSLSHHTTGSPTGTTDSSQEIVGDATKSTSQVDIYDVTTLQAPDSQEVTDPTIATTPNSGEVLDSQEVTEPFTTSGSVPSTSSTGIHQTATDSREDMTATGIQPVTSNSNPQTQFDSGLVPHTSKDTTESSSEEVGIDLGTPLANLNGALTLTQQPGSVLLPPGIISLQACQQRHQFVCAAKPVHDFTASRHCEADWVGHGLVSRCYRVVSQEASLRVAKRYCRRLGGQLATADTPFFANVTRVLLDRLHHKDSFGTRVWIDTPNSDSSGDCRVIQVHASDLQPHNCDASLPYFCQKDIQKSTALYDSSREDLIKDTPSLIMNMTSWNPQPLLCPLRPTSRHDIVTWYKDGQPIPSDIGSSDYVVRSTNSRNPEVLHLTTRILNRLGVKDRRMQQPALLQGVYWCRVWQQHPLQSATSNPVYVRFLDVVSLQGFIKTSGISMAEATFFNDMRDSTGLPAIIGRGLQKMNDRIHPAMQSTQPFLSDVITTIQHANAETKEVEFRTYLCLSTEAMSPQDRGRLVDRYLSGLHTELIASEDIVRRDWNLSLSFEHAFRLLMTEMCPESELLDEGTGYTARFPSTPVNQHAVSKQSCDGMFTGYAVCRGDLQSGARWAQWSVDMACDESMDSTDSDSDDKPTKFNPEDVIDTGHGILVPAKPNHDLLDIGEVHIEQGNVADVTERLADILDTSVELTDADVEVVADIIDRVALVPILPQDMGMTLMKTVNRVLDSPLPTLQRAQQRSQASTRILKDLDKFSEKLDFGQKGHVRYVTPNVAMEVWNTRKAREPVIGFAAKMGKAANSPLSEARILTLSNRTWADLHLSQFDVAIELPDQLVSSEKGVGNGRLSMAIYRRPGLFLSSMSSGNGSEDSSEMPELNSAIISATLASQNVNNLKDRVRLIFRPLKSADGKTTQCVYWDFSLPAGGGWSSQGCVYNGTVQGRDICLCDHLTNFAVLLDFYGDTQMLDQANTTALSVITIIGLSLSILGLALTLLTLLFFKKLRKGRAQQTLLHMATALLCSEAVVLVGLKQTTNYAVCLTVAILLHYFILASFLWMLVEAILQYLTFVKVLGTYVSKYTLKTVLPAWTVPLLPVIAVLATDYTQYRGRRDYCWMSLDAFYYYFALPVGVIIIFNIVTFIIIMVSLVRRPEGLRSTRNKNSTVETNIKAAFTIFILLGLTWTFGYLAIADARLPFQYMFTIFSSLQGFLIFVLLVVRRRQFREQWRTLCCGWHSPAGGQKVTPTLSNSGTSQSSRSSFTSSSRSRTSSGCSIKTLDNLIKRADSNASHKAVHPQLSAKSSSSGKSHQ